MQITLTPEDCAAIEAAADVLKRLCDGPVCSASIGFIGGDRSTRGFFTATTSDRHQSFSGKYSYAPASVPAQLNEALGLVHAANPDEETRKAQRIAELRAVLARLEGEAA